MDYIYHELDSSSVERFEAHLHSCPGCTELISGFEQTRSAFQELPEEDPPAAVSAFLLREAAAAVAPEEEGFWEKLRVGLRAMVMHPAMSIATTMVLVLGVSFYIYKAGPAPGDREMIDVPLVEEEHSIDQDRTAAIGMHGTETETEKKAFAGKDQPAPVKHANQPPAGAAATRQVAADESQKNEEPARLRKLQAQAPAPKEAGYAELAGLSNNKVGAGGAKSASGPAPRADKPADGKGKAYRTSLRDNLLRKVATATPSADPAPAPPPPAKPMVARKPSASRPQLAKRNEKASLSYGDYEDDALAGESNAEGVAGGTTGEAGSSGQGIATGRAMPKARPRKKPAPARRRARSADKKDSLDSLNYWDRGGGREMEPVAKQQEAADDERKAEQKESDDFDGSRTEQKKVAYKARKKKGAPAPASAPAPVTTQTKSPAPEAQQQRLTPPERARLLLVQGYNAKTCLKAYYFYDQAIAMKPSFAKDAQMRRHVQACAASLSKGTDERPLVVAQKRYPRLYGMLNPEVKRVKARRRIASKEAAERKAGKKSKAKPKAKKVRPSDKAATSY